MRRDPVNRSVLLTALSKLSATRGELSSFVLLERAENEAEVKAALEVASARIRFLAKKVHPDAGGSADRFRQLMKIRDAVWEAQRDPKRFVRPSTTVLEASFITIKINGVEYSEASSASWRESR